MRPIFRIVANGADITAKIQDRLLELRLHDEAGLGSDTATITLDNRDRAIRIPPKGAVLTIALGYEESGLVPKGQFTVDETRVSGPPHRMTIKAKAADMRKALKEPRSASYDGITVGDLVKTIAARHDLKPRCSAEMAAIDLGHVDQTEESDLHLLTRLAGQYGATAKPANGCLLFVPSGEAKSATGQSLSSVSIDLAVDGGTYDATFADRKDYGAVVARWRNQGSNEDVEITVDADDAEADAPTYRMRNTFADEAAARAAAKAKLAALSRGTATLSLSDIIGKPSAGAECPLTVANAQGDVDAAAWRITSTDHTFTSSGLTTSIEAEAKK